MLMPFLFENNARFKAKAAQVSFKLYAYFTYTHTIKQTNTRTCRQEHKQTN